MLASADRFQCGPLNKRCRNIAQSQPICRMTPMVGWVGPKASFMLAAEIPKACSLSSNAYLQSPLCALGEVKAAIRMGVSSQPAAPRRNYDFVPIP